MKCYFCAILNQMCKIRMEQEHQFIDYIEQSIIKNWDKDALTDYKGITLQYKDVARKIAKFHIVLESAGIQPGDKIAVCGRNSAHWAVTFLATITYGAVIVPILHEFKADNIHNIVNHSEAKLLFVGDQAWEKLFTASVIQRISVPNISVIGKTVRRNWLSSIILPALPDILKASCSPIAASGRT